MLKDRLQIILITYNRQQCVEDTLKQFFTETSPVKYCNFLVLDNNSTDGTEAIVRSWQNRFQNICYRKNKYNLGLAGNIARAMELADKDYVWIIGDDDKYDFTNWSEVDNAINNNEKLICIARYAIPDKFKEDIPHQLLQVTFISGAIYKTDLFDDTIIRNTLDNVYTLFPHLCPIVKLLNDGGKVYVVNKAISYNGIDIEKTDSSYARGARSHELYMRSRTMSWIVGYCNILSQLRDKELKERAIEMAICSKSVLTTYHNFYTFMNANYLFKESFMNFIDVYINVSPKLAQQLKYIYFNSALKGKCDIATIPVWTLLLLKVRRFVFYLERTPDERHLTIFGLKITTKRKRYKKSL